MNLFVILFSVLAVLASTDASRVGGKPRKLLFLDLDVAGTIGDLAGSIGDLIDADILGQIADLDIIGQVGEILGGILGGGDEESEAPSAAPSAPPTASPTSSPTVAMVDTDDTSNSTVVGEYREKGARSLVSEVGLFSVGEIVDEAMVDEGSEMEVELDNAETDIEGNEAARKVRRGLR